MKRLWRTSVRGVSSGKIAVNWEWGRYLTCYSGYREEVMVVFVGGHLVRLLSTCFFLLIDAIRLACRSKEALIAENLFLRRQLGLYQERKASRRRPCPATKLALVILSRFFDCFDALAIVKPNTFTRWHRIGFRLFWRWKSLKSGRPPLPRDVRVLIVQMAKENPTWGEERISDELSLKLGLHMIRAPFASI
jgi:hypothetical protein